jgi:hypothetical protein
MKIKTVSYQHFDFLTRSWVQLPAAMTVNMPSRSDTEIETNVLILTYSGHTARAIVIEEYIPDVPNLPVLSPAEHVARYNANPPVMPATDVRADLVFPGAYATTQSAAAPLPPRDRPERVPVRVPPRASDCEQVR